MDKKRIIIYFCFCLCFGLAPLSTVFGQLLTVGDQKVSREEFVASYEKNAPTTTYTENSLRDYLERMIVYNLKVQEAFAKGIDKQPQIQSELENYAAQLAQPYLTDQELLESMLQEIYDYSSQDVHARQIMVRCSPYASAQDTLAAYKLAMHIRSRLLKGEDFNEVAAEESEKSAEVEVNSRQEKQVSSSDLRYFSSFTLPYNLEKFAFNAKKGDFSMPLRSDFAYHILQVLDRQPTLGKINASQIFLSVQEDDSDEEAVKRKADSLYFLITSGKKSFEEVARQYSDDKHSGMRGGRMAEFNVTRVAPKFVENLYKMPIEVVSRPFRDAQGYHIVIIHSVSGIDDYKTLRPELLFRLSRDARATLIKQSFVNKLLKIYPLVENKDALKKFASSVDSTLLDGWWEYEPDENADSVICRVGDLTMTFAQFGKVINDNQMDYHQDVGELFMTFIERNYRNSIGELAIQCEMKNIDKKYVEYARALDEYSDGILAYEITNQEVWERSSMDTTGLYDYYESQKHCYMWPARIQALIFKYDIRHINTELVGKFLVSAYKKRLSSDQIIEQANKNFDPRYISVTVNVYEPGQNKFADRVNWTQMGLSQDIAAGGFEKGFVYIYHYYPATCKSLEDVRGIMVGQYQQVLENEWIKELKAKYKVSVNEAEFRDLIKR